MPDVSAVTTYSTLIGRYRHLRLARVVRQVFHAKHVPLEVSV